MTSQNVTTLSDDGDAVLVEVEGDVLRAYRDIGGTWSIGTGLTAASGVVKPKAGMVITREESKRLRRLSLARNYEPRVAKALPTTKQNVFDGGVLFDFNTGAISRATWVGLFLQGLVQKAKASFFSWNKVKGNEVKGLTTRRGREWNIIEFANYALGASAPASVSPFSDYAQDFKAFGYDIAAGAVATVSAFQRDQKLTVDGVIGPATRATIARVKAARAANNATAGGAVVGAPAGATANGVTAPSGSDIDLHGLVWVAAGMIGVALVVYGITLAWRYRGPLFAWLPEPIKDWFEARGIVLGRAIRS